MGKCSVGQFLKRSRAAQRALDTITLNGCSTAAALTRRRRRCSSAAATQMLPPCCAAATQVLPLLAATLHNRARAASPPLLTSSTSETSCVTIGQSVFRIGILRRPFAFFRLVTVNFLIFHSKLTIAFFLQSTHSVHRATHTGPTREGSCAAAGCLQGLQGKPQASRLL